MKILTIFFALEYLLKKLSYDFKVKISKNGEVI